MWKMLKKPAVFMRETVGYGREYLIFSILLRTMIILKTVSIYENRFFEFLLRIASMNSENHCITTMRKSCPLQLRWFVFISNTRPTVVYIPLMFLASFVQVRKQRLPPHITPIEWNTHLTQDFFELVMSFRLFWLLLCKSISSSGQSLSTPKQPTICSSNLIS
jgi:hypothetical protein